MKYIVCLFAVAFSFPGTLSLAGKVGKDTSEAITAGVQLRNVTDNSRTNWQGTGPRPIGTVIWYPAETGAKLRAPDYGSPPEFSKYFVSYPLAEQAEISR
jgi:hypothetical protein